MRALGSASSLGDAVKHMFAYTSLFYNNITGVIYLCVNRVNNYRHREKHIAIQMILLCESIHKELASICLRIKQQALFNGYIGWY